MELIGLQRGAMVKAGEKWRLTFGVSAYGDVLQFLTLGTVSGSNLRDTAAWVYAHIPGANIPAYPASQPTVNETADTFALDIKFNSTAGSLTAGTVLAALDGLVRGYTLVRAQQIGPTETSSQGTAGRETATTSAPQSGVTIGQTVADAAEGLGSFLGSTVQLVLVVGAIVLVSGLTSKSRGGLNWGDAAPTSRPAVRGRRTGKAKAA